MQEINNLLEFLEKELSKPIKEFGKEEQDGVEYFTPKEYEFKKYNCELSELFSGEKSVIETFRKVYKNEFFELHHPFYNDIKTRAVYNKYYFGVCNFCAIFLIDENHKYPWILYRFHSDYAIFTKDGIFVASKVRINYDKGDEVWRGHWLEIVNLFKKWLPTIDKKDLVYKDAPYFLILSDARPYHLFNDQLNYLYLLDLKNSKAISTSKKSFFIPQGYKLTQDSTLTMPVIFSHSVGRESINLMRKNVLSESLQSFNTLVSEEDKNWGGGRIA